MTTPPSVAEVLFALCFIIVLLGFLLLHIHLENKKESIYNEEEEIILLEKLKKLKEENNKILTK